MHHRESFFSTRELATAMKNFPTREEFTALSGRVDTLSTRVDGLTLRVDEGFARVDQRLDKIDDRLVRFDETLKGVTDTLSRLDERMSHGASKLWVMRIVATMLVAVSGAMWCVVQLTLAHALRLANASGVIPGV